MSKYNLMDIYEGMSDKEFSAAEEAGRLKKHPEKDKIQKIKDLMSKEKSIKELDSTFKEGDKVSVFMRGTEANSPEPATIVMMDPSGVAIVRNKEGQEDEVFIKDMNQIKENKKEEQLKTAYAALDKAEQDGDIRKQELALAAIDLIKGDINENNIEEMTGEIYNQIDSLIDQNLKMEFIDKFIAIQDDLIEAGDEFDKMDLIDYLASELQKFGARNFEEGKNRLMKEEEMISKDKYDRLLDGAASRYEELENQFIKFIQDEYDKDFDMEDFRDFQGGMSDEASIEESNKSLKEHFGRFMKDYQ